MNNFGDDISYRNAYPSLSAFLKFMYTYWASPGPLLIAQWYLIRLPKIYFIILNICMFLLIFYSIIAITGSEEIKHTNIFVLCFIILYPIIQMGTAGWIITSIQYVPPLSFGLYSFVYLKLIINKIEISRCRYFSFWIALIISSGGLQMSLAIFGIYLLYLIYFIYHKKIFVKFIVLQLLTSLFFIIYHLTSKGNLNRYIKETIKWFPDFNMLSSVQKIKLGVISTLENLIYSKELFFLAFTILIFIAIYKKYICFIVRFITILPLFFTIILGTFRNIFKEIFPNFINTITSGATLNIVNLHNFNFFRNYVSIILCFIILGSISFSICLIFDDIFEKIIVLVIFFTGFCTRMVLSFSPTLYASSTRTFIYFYYSLIICSVLIFNKIILDMNKEQRKNITIFFCLMAMIAYFENLFRVCNFFFNI
jgi:hypothetical protein